MILPLCLGRRTRVAHPPSAICAAGAIADCRNCDPLSPYVVRRIFLEVVRLSAADYTSVLEFVRLAGGTHGPDPFPEEVLAQLRELIPCDVVSYGDFDPSNGGSWRSPSRWVGEPHAPVTRSIRETAQALRDQYPHTPFDSTALLRWSDRLSRRALRRLDSYQEVGRPLGCEYELTLWLKDDSAVLGGFAFDRFRGDFSDRDLRVLEVLLPHLLQFARRAAIRWPEAAAVLTPREREILGWVARGKANREIADRLSVAPGTISKHLDNIYAKLEVPNRAAAVSRAHGLC
jgi:DNA-binding CsgD family transcriptional regulator